MAAFAIGVLPNIYEFHLYTGNSTILSRTSRSARIKCTSQVEPGAFTPDATDRLRALYAQ